MARCKTFALVAAITLLLAADSLAHYAPTASAAKSDVVIFAAHFDPVPGVCTVGLGSSAMPTDKLGLLGDPEAVTHCSSVPLRAALATHGRFYRPRKYRTDAVYFAPPAWSAGAVIEGDVDLRSLDMFVQVVTTREADCRFKFQLMFDLVDKELPEGLDLLACIDVDVADPAAWRMPSGVGLNPALPASFGTVQHAMTTAKLGFGQPGNGVGGAVGGFGGLASTMWMPAAGDNGDLLGSSLLEQNYDLQGEANQQAPTGGENNQHLPEPSSLVVFAGLSLLTLCSAAMRKRARKRA